MFSIASTIVPHRKHVLGMSRSLHVIDLGCRFQKSVSALYSLQKTQYFVSRYPTLYSSPEEVKRLQCGSHVPPTCMYSFEIQCIIQSIVLVLVLVLVQPTITRSRRHGHYFKNRIEIPRNFVFIGIYKLIHESITRIQQTPIQLIWDVF